MHSTTTAATTTPQQHQHHQQRHRRIDELLAQLLPTLHEISLTAAALDAEATMLTAAIKHERDVVQHATSIGIATQQNLKARDTMEIPKLAQFWLNPPTVKVSNVANNNNNNIATTARIILDSFADFQANVTRRLDTTSRRLRLGAMAPARKLKCHAVAIAQRLAALKHKSAVLSATVALTNDTTNNNTVASSATATAKRNLMAAWEDAAAIEESEEGAAMMVLLKSLAL